jgi:flagellar hook-basal body complex protein FliE
VSIPLSYIKDVFGKIRQREPSVNISTPSPTGKSSPNTSFEDINKNVPVKSPFVDPSECYLCKQGARRRSSDLLRKGTVVQRKVMKVIERQATSDEAEDSIARRRRMLRGVAMDTEDASSSMDQPHICYNHQLRMNNTSFYSEIQTDMDAIKEKGEQAPPAKPLARRMSHDLLEVGLNVGRLLGEQCKGVAHKFQSLFPHSSFLNLGTDSGGQPGALHGVMLSLQATVPVLASKKRYLQSCLYHYVYAYYFSTKYY